MYLVSLNSEFFIVWISKYFIWFNPYVHERLIYAQLDALNILFTQGVLIYSIYQFVFNIKYFNC